MNRLYHNLMGRARRAYYRMTSREGLKRLALSGLILSGCGKKDVQIVEYPYNQYARLAAFADNHLSFITRCKIPSKDIATSMYEYRRGASHSDMIDAEGGIIRTTSVDTIHALVSGRSENGDVVTWKLTLIDKSYKENKPRAVPLIISSSAEKKIITTYVDTLGSIAFPVKRRIVMQNLSDSTKNEEYDATERRTGNPFEAELNIGNFFFIRVKYHEQVSGLVGKITLSHNITGVSGDSTLSRRIEDLTDTFLSESRSPIKRNLHLYGIALPISTGAEGYADNFPITELKASALIDTALEQLEEVKKLKGVLPSK